MVILLACWAQVTVPTHELLSTLGSLAHHRTILYDRLSNGRIRSGGLPLSVRTIIHRPAADHKSSVPCDPGRDLHPASRPQWISPDGVGGVVSSE